MERRPREAIARCRIDLNGGGRLDGTSGVVDVRLEPGDLRWARSGPRSVDVEGEVRAYIYVLEKGGREVSGKGVSIPFRSRFELPPGAPDELEAYVDELRSEHDFDPVSQEFQHRVVVVLALAAKGEAAPPARAFGSAGGETRFSQVRREERPQAVPPETPLETRQETQPRPALPAEVQEPPAEAEGKQDGGKTLVWKAFPPPIAK